MRRVVYWQKADRLVYLDEKATPEFWDSRWKTEGKPPLVNPRDDVVIVTAKFLQAGSRVLEGVRTWQQAQSDGGLRLQSDRD